MTGSVGSTNRQKRQKAELFSRDKNLRSLMCTSGHVQVLHTRERLEPSTGACPVERPALELWSCKLWEKVFVKKEDRVNFQRERNKASRRRNSFGYTCSSAWGSLAGRNSPDFLSYCLHVGAASARASMLWHTGVSAFLCIFWTLNKFVCYLWIALLYSVKVMSPTGVSLAAP